MLTSAESQTVNFIYDGLHLTPMEYASCLQQAVESGTVQADSYSNGGVVDELERKFAQWLGKERAVFMPTGTLANHMALRQLAGPHARALVQAESHLYNDTGDCAQTLSGLTLIPLAPGQAHFTLDEVQAVLTRSETGRVPARIGVISIETPVRRQADAMFDYDEMCRIAQFAREQGIPLHLDGARLFVESVHSGIAPDEYANWFDTVYVSLYKCFNAASGAILAGSAEFTENLYHIRRMFGGSLSQAWPCAAVALQFVDTFIEDYRAAWHQAEILLKTLDAHPQFRSESISNGTHIVRLHVRDTHLEAFRKQLQQHHIDLPAVVSGQPYFALKVNPSLNRSSGQAVAETMIAVREGCGLSGTK